MKTVKQISAVATLLCGLLFYACVDDAYNLSLDPAKRNLRKTEIKMPVGTVNAELMKWLKAGLSEKDSTELANLVKVFKKGEYNDPEGEDYEGVVYMQFNHADTLDWADMKTMMDISDLEFSYNLEKPLSKAAFEYVFPEQHRTLVADNKEEAEYEKITFASANIGITMDIPEGITGAVEVTIPEIQLNGGQPNTFVFNFSEGGIAGGQQEMNLQNGTLTFDRNGINVQSRLRIDNFSSIFVSGNVAFTITVKNLNVTSAEGYFGKYRVKEKDGESFEFNIFDELQIVDGKIVFGDIILEASADNEMGIPFQVTAENIGVYKNDEFIDSLMVDNSNFMQIHVTSAGENGNSGSGFLSVRGNNSNIETLASDFPNKITFDISGLSNWEGRTGRNFITDKSMLNVDLSLKFPLHFRAETYSRNDTVDFNARTLYGDWVTQASDLEYLHFNFTCENRLPFDANFTAIIIDSIGNRIGELTANEGSKILEGGDRNNPATTKFTISVTGEQAIEYIDKNAKKIVLATTASTTNDGKELVKIYENSGLRIIVNADARLTVPTKFE